MMIMKVSSIAVLSLLATVDAQGIFDHFYFNTAANQTCEGVANNSFYWCNAPNVCAQNNLLNKYYCCASGERGGICRTSPETCSNGTTQQCGSGSSAYCCLANVEQCTQRADTSDACWSTSQPFENISVALLNSAYKSLLSAEQASASARPSASASQLVLNYSSLIAAASKSSVISSSVTISPTATSSATSSSAGLSGGAIAGIVIGAIAAIALVVLGTVLLLRRRRRSPHYRRANANGRNDPHDSAPQDVGAAIYHNDDKAAVDTKTTEPSELRSLNSPHEAPGSGIQEMYTRSAPAELPGSEGTVGHKEMAAIRSPVEAPGSE